MDYNNCTYLRKCFVLRKSSIWYYKHLADGAYIKRKNEKRFAHDIYNLYENSSFADVKIEAFGQFVLCHKLIIASRVPCCWKLLSEIGKLQRFRSKEKENIFVISLDSVKFFHLELLIKSLYTNQVNERNVSTFRALLNKQLNLLKVENHSKKFDFYLEKLHEDEEQFLQQFLLHQLKTGEISEKRGNLTVLSEYYSQSLLKQLECVTNLTPNFWPDITNGVICEETQCDLVGSKRSSEDTCTSTDYSTKVNLNSTNQENEGVICSNSTEPNVLYNCVSSDINSENKLPLSITTPNQITKSYVGISGLAKIDVRSKPYVSKSSENSIQLPLKGRNDIKFSSLQDLHQTFSCNSKSGTISDKTDDCETSSLEVELTSTLDELSSSLSSTKTENEANTKCEGESNSDFFSGNRLIRSTTFDLPSKSVESINPVDPVKSKVESSETTNVESEKITTDITLPTAIMDATNDHHKIRDLERLKGSLIFDHNLQTFSNIPTTNLMTAPAPSPPVDRLGFHPMPNSVMGQNTVMTTDSLSEQIISSNPTLQSQKSHEKMGLELQNLVCLRSPDSSSPSPDSLSVDLPPESLKMEEKYDNESKMLSSSYSESRNFFGYIGSDSITTSNLNTDTFRILKTGWESENKPIVGGGLTSWNNGVKRDSLEGNHPREIIRQTSLSSAKDLDSIPVISGYVAFEDHEREEDKHLEDKKQQSIFSMFINLDELPSPDKDTKMVKHKAEHTGGMCMFIEADTKPSTKVNCKSGNGSTAEILKKGGISFQEMISTDAIRNADVNKKQPFESKDICSTSKNSDNFFISLKSDANTENTECERHNKAAKYTNSSKDDKNSDQSFFVFVDNSMKISDKSDARRGSEQFTETVEKEQEMLKDKVADKSFFIFVDGSNRMTQDLPRFQRAPKPFQPKRKDQGNCMSKSAPSDSVLFKKHDPSTSIGSTPGVRDKLMTKSAIDREEFLTQIPSRCNVSVNDRNSESSKIPRPVSNFKEKLMENQSACVGEKKSRKQTKKRPKSCEQTSKSLEVSTSEKAVSLNVSFSEEAMVSSVVSDIETVSEVSDVSSLLSSLERSTEISDQDGKEIQKNLADDLLKMLLDEINTDVTIQIGEKKIRAHKCILASRCVYFAAMLSGHWVESAGNVIKLQGFCYEAVLEALKHIYSGSSVVPEGINVGELAALSDMLALDGLKDVVTLHYKSKICHYFHKPCEGCLSGVLEVLPVAGAYCLDELFNKCIKWITKYFTVVFPTRNFASLPFDLQDRCVKQLLDDMSVSNVIDMAVGGERVSSTLPSEDWVQPVLESMAKLIDNSACFIATNMPSVLASDRFLSQGKNEEWNMESLEEVLKMACRLIKPDEAVLSHIQLSKLTENLDDESNTEYSEIFLRMCERLLKQTEKFIIHNSNRVAVCRKWPLLPPETQKRIKDSALIVLEFSKPRVGSAPKPRSRGTSLEPASRVRANSVSENRLSRSPSASVVPSAKGILSHRVQNPATARCHTPPPGVLRASLQTPPPTRTSTLRAKQNSTQRCQSAKGVAENLRKVQEIDTTIPRGGTFTSFPKMEQSTPKVPKRSPSSGLNVMTTEVRGQAPDFQQNSFACNGDGASSAKDSNAKYLQTTSTPLDPCGNVERQSRSSALGVTPKGGRGGLPIKQRNQIPILKDNNFSGEVTKAHDHVKVKPNSKSVNIPGLGNRSGTFCKDE